MSFPAPDDYRHEDVRVATCDWLRANGVNPYHVPAEPDMSIADGQLTLLVKVRDENGRDVIDGDGVMTRTITVPVVVPPPPLVEQWLAPRCPTCGR
jgi:hypothetical protein